MGNSLFDQMKKAGLIDEKKAKQATTEKYKSHKSQKQQGKSKGAPVDETKRLAQIAQAEEVERNRVLNRQRQDDIERKAIAAQIKQLVETSRIKDRDGEIAYHFTHDGKVKRIYVSEEIRKQLSSGQLAIIVLYDQIEIVPQTTAEKIKQRDERCVIAPGDSKHTGADNENDLYAAYKVPDDLMW